MQNANLLHSPFPLTVVRNPRAKRLTLRVNTRRGEIVLTLPKRCSVDKAQAFVSSHQHWIEKQSKSLITPVFFHAGAEILLHDRLHLITPCPQGSGSVWIEEDRLCVKGAPEFLHRRVRDFLIREARIRFREIANALAQQTGKSLGRFTVRDMVSRWGSCSSRGDLSLNWRLILAPSYVAQYVIAHEVAHLTHMDHRPAFWQLVHTLIPDPDRAITWLRANGHMLYRYS